jgi:hypothetical protein
MPADPTPPKFELGDWVDITFRKAVVIGVAKNGSIEVQNAGPSFWVHPEDNDTQIVRVA